MEAFADSIQLWSQLSLAPSLEISQSIQTAVSSTDISIFINNGASTAKTQPKAWLLDNIDIKAPKSVLPAEFERLHIQLSFHQIQKGSRPASKRVKSAPPDLDSPESMLFDYISGLEGDARSIFFQTVAGVLPEDLSSSIAKYFDGFEIGHGAAELHDKMLLPSQEGVLSKGAAMAAEIVASDNNLNTTQLLRRGSLPKEATDKLKAWVDAHSGNLNPTRQEKLELTKVTGLRRGMLFAFISSPLLLADTSWQISLTVGFATHVGLKKDQRIRCCNHTARCIKTESVRLAKSLMRTLKRICYSPISKTTYFSTECPNIQAKTKCSYPKRPRQHPP